MLFSTSVLFSMGTPLLAVVLALLVGGAATLGASVGRRGRARFDAHREPVGVVQGTLLGLVGLLLAFGLTMAVGRYDTRRALVVQEANDIGTTYLRAQLLAEPVRSRSLELLREYADEAVALADSVPDTARFEAAAARLEELQDDLWAAAGEAVALAPTESAPRLYVESLNPMIDSHTDRVASLRNRVPSTVVLLQVFGSAIAIGVLALYLALLGRGFVTPLVAAAVVALILFISLDLDRPHRGLITVPDRALVAARASMEGPPAFGGP